MRSEPRNQVHGRRPVIAQDRLTGRRGPNQARQHDLIASGIETLADANAREGEFAGELLGKITIAAADVLSRMPLHADIRAEIATAIGAASTVAVIQLLRDRESPADLGSIDVALRAGLTAAQALAAMSSALDERMPVGGWRAPEDSDRIHDPLGYAHKILGNARHNLAIAQALLVAAPEVNDNGLGHGVRSIRGPRGPYGCDCNAEFATRAEIDAHIKELA